MVNLMKGVALAFLLTTSPLAATDDKPPAEVMLFGVFHFANPGRDLVKTDQVNVMTDENQAYLESLAAELSQFNPTRVLLEFDPERDSEIQERFQLYVSGEYELPSNEIYQLGFRVAALSDAETVHGFDETNVHWNAQPLFDYMDSNDPETRGKMTALIEEVTADEENAHARLSLQELLVRANDPERDSLNRSMYLLTNQVGEQDNFVGADATASWWHRNFRMYAMVQRHAQPGERVLVIGGQGHIAILRQLLADDRERRAVEVLPYLK